jgi:hypothetical protein
MRHRILRSQECKAKRHSDCDGYVQRKEWFEHDQPCECECHKPKYLKE